MRHERESISGIITRLMILLIWSCPVFSQNNEQMLASSFGKYCRVKVSQYEQRFDTLEILIQVEWINESYDNRL